MKTTEGNKLIAEFMGAIVSKQTLFENDKDIETLVIDVYSRPPFFNNDLYNTYGWMSYENLDKMLYHSSWDWLMPVINKIYESDWYYKWKDTSGQFEKEVFINTKFIETTWEQVVEFIKWYNENRKNQ